MASNLDYSLNSLARVCAAGFAAYGTLCNNTQITLFGLGMLYAGFEYDKREKQKEDVEKIVKAVQGLEKKLEEK